MIQEKNNKLEISINEMLYYIFISVILFAKGMGLYDGQIAFKICLLLGVAFIALKLCLEKHTLTEVLTIASLVILGLFSYINSGEKGMFIYILLIIGIKNIPIQRVFRVGLLVWGLSFGLLIILDRIGLVSSPVFIHKKFGDFIIRYGLGYPHPNVLHISYLLLMIFILYVIDNQKIYRTGFLLFIGNILIFCYSLSYTGFIICTLYLLIHIYFIKRKQFSIVENIIIQCILPACVLFSLLGPVVLNPEGKLFSFFNKILNTRYYLSRYFLTNCPITLWGQRYIAEDAARTMDCSYTFAFVNYGVVLFAIIIILYYLLIRNMLQNNRRKELAIVIAVLIAGASEPFLFNTSFKNVSFLFMGEYIYWSISQYSKKRKQTFMYKEMSLIPVRQYTLKIPDTILFYIKSFNLFIKSKLSRKSIFIMMVMTCIFTGIYIYGKTMPCSYYAPVAQCSEYSGEKKYIDKENLPKDFNNVFFNYVDKKTPMYEFKGRVCQIELARTILEVYFVIFALEFILYILSILVIEKKGWGGNDK